LGIFISHPGLKKITKQVVVANPAPIFANWQDEEIAEEYIPELA
jgi:hypothetical protein